MKCPDIRLVALPVYTTGKLVGRNQVDMTKQAFQARSQFIGMLQLVVDPAEQSILKGDAASCLFHMPAAGGQELVIAILSGDGHQLTPDGIIGRMQGLR